MKKILFLLLFVVCFTLVSCGSDEPADKPSETKPEPEHQHSLGGWQKDNEYHWHECSGCDELFDKAIHVWNSGEVTQEPTQDDAGIKTYTCTVCSQTKNEMIPDLETPATPVDPNLPVTSAGWVDAGYRITNDPNGGEYLIQKFASAAQWEAAVLDITNYTSSYSAFSLNITTTNVTKFSIELIVSGGEADWAESVSVYQTTLEDGTHDIYVDFSYVQPVSKVTWNNVPGYYIKDYQIIGMRFALDTSVDNVNDLIKEDATCAINELVFNKVAEEQPPVTPEDPNAPTIKPGYRDPGYMVSLDEVTGGYNITKFASANQWESATLDISNYSSAYSAFTIKFTTSNVTNFSIELLVLGGEADWAENVTVYQASLTDGEHEVYVDFSLTQPVSTTNWMPIPGYYIKDYQVAGIKIALDTAVDNVNDLIKEDAYCIVEEVKFDKFEEDLPNPELPDPNAPTTIPGYCDPGYSIVTDELSGTYTVNKFASAAQWESARLGLVNYTSAYSAFTIKFTTTNVRNISIQLYVEGLDAGWTPYIGVYQSTVTDGEHEIYVDFTLTQPVSSSDWLPIPGYYIRDYNVSAIIISLDTAVDNPEDLINEDATCVVSQIKFKNVDGSSDGTNEEYVPTNTILSFSDENQDKVITEPTFDISQYTENASSYIKPYQLFGSGMCLQRDAVNRIWGTATNTQYIAAEFKGSVYYGSVDQNGNWEIYLPKMNAGGPYTLTLITEAGRLKLSQVYIGEVFFLGGQSNMEMQPQHCGDVLKDLYATTACVNNEIRMLSVGYAPSYEPTTDVAQYWQWVGANQTTIPNFTAVGYLFGKQMQEELGCPVGLISAPIGGSNIEFWLNQENYNKVQEFYQSYTTEEVYMTPTLGYNGMLYPLAGVNVRGVVWYQGESNAYAGQTTEQFYDKALEIFIDQCREMFNNEQLSFTICQLARYEGNPLGYSVINEKINQVALNDPYIVVARNLDQGTWNDIHPKDKRAVAYRAAYETLRVFFNFEKPEPIKVTDYTFNDDGSVTITLSANANLVNGANGFEVYVDGSYSYDADVTISGNKLTVTASGEITKVRYGYTCQMTTEIQNDVSKMVTVYDENGFPLDLFLISK